MEGSKTYSVFVGTISKDDPFYQVSELEYGETWDFMAHMCRCSHLSDIFDSAYHYLLRRLPKVDGPVTPNDEVIEAYHYNTQDPVPLSDFIAQVIKEQDIETFWMDGKVEKVIEQCSHCSLKEINNLTILAEYPSVEAEENISQLQSEFYSFEYMGLFDSEANKISK